MKSERIHKESFENAKKSDNLEFLLARPLGNCTFHTYDNVQSLSFMVNFSIALGEKLFLSVAFFCNNIHILCLDQT